jgi:hypothetical protein
MKEALRPSAPARPSGLLESSDNDVYSCADLNSLQESYKEAVAEFTENARNLHAATEAPEHALLSRLAMRSKVKAETAHRALRSHIVEHGCC